MDVYAKSTLVDDANTKMDELRAKLEQKLIASAELYYNIEDYLAAAVTYENVLQEYPDTQDAENIGLLIMRSYFNYAGQSVACRKAERYDKAISSYQNFVGRYPESAKREVAEALHERSMDLKQRALNEINLYKINCNEFTEKN